MRNSSASKSELIVMTSTVIVPVINTDVMRNNLESRLNDVLRAVKSWALFTEKTSRSLVLIENSGSVKLIYKYLPSEYRRKIMLIEAPEDTKSTEQGISAGEYGMIQFLIDNYDIKKHSFIWKISGRNYCPNARKIISWDGNADIVATRNSSPAHFVNTRLFGMKPEVLKEFAEDDICFSRKDETDRGKCFSSMEHYMTQFVLDQEVRGRRQVDFVKIPRFTGFSGSTNKIIDSKKRRFFLILLNPFRRLIVKLLAGNTP